MELIPLGQGGIGFHRGPNPRRSARVSRPPRKQRSPRKQRPVKDIETQIEVVEDLLEGIEPTPSYKEAPLLRPLMQGSKSREEDDDEEEPELVVIVEEAPKKPVRKVKTAKQKNEELLRKDRLREEELRMKAE